MKSLAVSVTAMLLALAASCLIDRKSDQFRCDPGDDCGAGKMCDQGFCVPLACPSECNGGCDTEQMTCDIECNAVGRCGTAACPAGYKCNIDCTKMNACGSVDCTTAASCDITCSDRNSCGPINCGSGACNIRCTDTSACGAISCGSSCACDVQCNIGTQCSTMTCPMGTTVLCTDDGTTATTCASDQQAGCGTCQ